MKNILKERTKSLCPTCFQEIPAQVYEEDGKVYMSKNCSQHGDFNFLIEKDAWIYKKLMNKDTLKQRRPFNNVMIAINHSCNLDCPICYLPNRNVPELPLEDIKKAISNFDGEGIRLSGGEPTLREDLPEIIRFIRQKGKWPVIITNGLKLADRGYVRKLKKVGLRLVCFSCNSFNDKAYKRINGRPLLKIKLKALKNLMRENMNIILSLMLVKGMNESELKKIYHFYCRHSYFTRLKIRTAVFSGRHSDTQQQIYLSDIVNMISKIMGVNKNDLVEHFLSFSCRFHLPCQLEIRPVSLLLRRLKIRKMQKSLLGKIKISFMLLSQFGFMGSLGVLTRYLKGRKPLNIGIRVWPDKYRIDLEEIKRCPSSHLINETGELISFCYGLTLNDKTLKL